MLVLLKSLDLPSLRYQNILVMGDFNENVEALQVKIFCENSGLASLVRTTTCCKNPDNPSCIDQVLTNVPRSFHNSCATDTGLSDFHRMVITAMKVTF